MSLGPESGSQNRIFFLIFVSENFVFGCKVLLPGVGVDGLWAATFRNPELRVPWVSQIFVFDLLYNFLKVFPHSFSKFLLFVRNRKLFYF